MNEIATAPLEESPEQVLAEIRAASEAFGAAREGTHIAAYAQARVIRNVTWLLAEGRWALAGLHNAGALVDAIRLESYRLSPAERKAIEQAVKDADASVSNVRIAKMLGVDEKTVRNDASDNSEDRQKNARENTEPTNDASDNSERRLSGGAAADLTARREERFLANARRNVRLEEIARANRELPGGVRYPIIYADPPWRYENPPIGASNRSIENHYPTMALEEICALKVKELAADDAVLYLWATAPKLAECFKVIEAWGFVYRTNVVWIKDKFGMGYHARNQHEILLIAKRGSIPPPLPEDRVSSIIHADRGEHSEKPAIFYELIERFYPPLQKIELFSRMQRPGWDMWGNEAAA